MTTVTDEQQQQQKKDVEESRETLKIMADKEFKDKFSTQLKTKWPIFFITHNEEKRLLSFLRHFSIVNGYDCYIWDVFRGLKNIVTDGTEGATSHDMKNSLGILEYILDDAKPLTEDAIERDSTGYKPKIYVLLDYFRFLQNRPVDVDIERRLKAIANLDSTVTTIITGPSYQTTDLLQNLIPVIDFPFPNRDELREALNLVVTGKNVQRRLGSTINKKTEEMEEDLISSVSGLTEPEACSAFSASLVRHHDWHIPTILEEKKQIISRSNILDYCDRTVGMADIGGLKNMTSWIKMRKSCFSQEARDYGLEEPKGMLILGFPGTGKSLTCKAISSQWKMPLLRLDFGNLFHAHIGESEQRSRDALKLAESISPCCLWIDEIEKGLAGAHSGGRTDGGVAMRVLGTFLTWMQDKVNPVFVIATANDHTVIPSEFMRAGRFDEIFFVDLPNANEREEIFAVHLKKKRYDPENFNLKLLSSKCVNFSGAEIEKVVGNAMLVGFQDDKRSITTKDLESQLKGFKTLYAQREDDFVALRNWANECCVKANAEEEDTSETVLHSAKNIDI